MLEADPLNVRLIGEAAAVVRSEAIIGNCDPEVIICRAIGLYEDVAPELRNGGRLVLEVDSTSNTIHNRRGIGRIVTILSGLVSGRGSKPVTRYVLNLPASSED